MEIKIKNGKVFICSLLILTSLVGCKYKIDKNTHYVDTQTTSFIEQDISELTPTPTSIPTLTAHQNTPYEFNLEDYGGFVIDGMPVNLYNSAKIKEWETVDVLGIPQPTDINLKSSYTFNELEEIMIELSKYDGVKLQVIGRSVEGRNLYNLVIDFPSNKEKKTIMLAGQVHACEFAGSVYILKQYAELLEKAQNDPYIKLLLENVRFVSMPVVNPDGREIIINGGSSIKKSNANGVDINRNFPATNAGQLKRNIELSTRISSKPSNAFYPGPYLGSEPETQAMMKWLNKYVPTASLYYDYHQQGGGFYYGKPWNPIEREQKKEIIAQFLFEFMNEGISPNEHYRRFNDSINYGFEGIGSSTTDYATDIANGLVFSEQYGRMVLEVNGSELPLLVYKSIENFKEYYKPINTEFVTITFEIAKGSDALGNGLEARKKMYEEYRKFKYDKLLIFSSEIILGDKKINEIKEYVAMDLKSNNDKELRVSYYNKLKVKVLQK